MKLRRLLEKDAAGILEWMKDDDINKFFRFDPGTQTEKTVIEFIKNSYSDTQKHYAVVEEDDEYLGTVSLKNIDKVNENAEYAISMRKKAQGTGAADFATREILKLAFADMALGKVYLNVLSDNLRAVAFYKKMGAEYEGTFRHHIKINGKFKDLSWYCFRKGEE